MSASVEVRTVPRAKLLGLRSLVAAVLVAASMAGGIAIGRSTVHQAKPAAAAADWRAAAERAGYTGRAGFSTPTADAGSIGGYSRAQLIRLGYTGRLGFSTASNR